MLLKITGMWETPQIQNRLRIVRVFEVTVLEDEFLITFTLGKLAWRLCIYTMVDAVPRLLSF
jgi:hypothetical protein